MNRLGFVKILAIVTGIAGIVVMLGWLFDIAVLKSILPQWVTMKFTTALSFTLSGLILYSITSPSDGDSGLVQVVLPISALLILLLMMTLFLSSVLNIFTGIENWFVRESDSPVKTTVPGRPSIGTMIAFCIFAIGGLGTFVRMRDLYSFHLLLGLLVSSISALALLGYLFDIPILYFTIDDISTAMAIHTAILFAFLGVGLVLLGKDSAELDLIRKGIC